MFCVEISNAINKLLLHDRQIHLHENAIFKNLLLVDVIAGGGVLPQNKRYRQIRLSFSNDRS